MIKALIIDDEKNARALLAHDLRELFPDIVVVGQAESVSSGIEAINTLLPDVVFLDIMMSDGTGFNLLEHFKAIHFKIIFVTAYNDFAVKAFKFSAVDYLLKPVNIDELQSAVKKIIEFPNPSFTKERVELLLDNIALQKNTFRKIILTSKNNAQVVQINSIIRCEAKKDYTVFFLTTGEVILVTKTLKEYDELLSEYGFIRVHKSHLVNSNYIIKYIKSDNPYLITMGSTQVPVSLRKKKEVQDMLRKIKP